MRKFALIATTAAALPLFAIAPALAQNNGATPQNQAQQNQAQQIPKGNAQQQNNAQPRNQAQSASQNLNGEQNNAENLSQGEIRQMQQALNQKGFNVGRADGKIGPRTKSALNQFQSKQGLQQTGQPDEQTLAALGIGESTTGQGPADQQNGPGQKLNASPGQQNPPAPGNNHPAPASK